MPAPAGIAEARRADDLEEAADHEEERHHEGQNFRRDRGPEDEDEPKDAIEDRGHRMLEEAGPMADPDGRHDFDRRREQEQPAEDQHRCHGRRHRSRDGGGADDHERDAEGEEPAPLLGEVLGDLDVEGRDVGGRHGRLRLRRANAPALSRETDTVQPFPSPRGAGRRWREAPDEGRRSPFRKSPAQPLTSALSPLSRGEGAAKRGEGKALLRRLAQRRIVGVAGRAVAVEGVAVPRVQRRAEPEAAGQVGIGDEGLAEGDRVGLAGRQRRLGARLVEILVGDIDAAERRLQRRAEHAGPRPSRARK